VNYLVGKPEEALRCHKTSLSIRTEIQDERGMALTLSWIGLVEAQMGELGMAQKSFEQSLSISQAKRDPARIIFSLLDLGSLAHEVGHPELARNLMEQARGLSRHMGEPLHECHLALQIGAAWLSQERFAEAEIELLKAKEIARKFSARRLLAEADLGLAECELRVGNRIHARHHARQAVDVAEKMGAVPLVGAALRILAQSLAGGEEGMDRVEARECFERSIALLAGCHAAMELSRTFAAYAAFEDALGRGAPAEHLRDRSIGIRRRAGIEGKKMASTGTPIDAQV
jgi:tetratricopeptide (TPR) repeat protein